MLFLLLSQILEPLIHGGGQEKNIRSGTLNVPGIVGFAKAIEIAQMEMDSENIMFRKWTDKMFEKFSQIGASMNGHPTKKLSDRCKYERASYKKAVT